MSIMSRKINGSDSLQGCRLEYYIACDCCGDEIEKGEPANIECQWAKKSKAYTVHKRCSRRFGIEHEGTEGGPLIWSNLRWIDIRAD